MKIRFSGHGIEPVEVGPFDEIRFYLTGIACDGEAIAWLADSGFTLLHPYCCSLSLHGVHFEEAEVVA